MADGLVTQDLEIPISLSFIGPNELNHHHHPHHHHHHHNNNNNHPPLPPNNNDPSAADKATQPPSHFPSTMNGNTTQQRPDERNSATPVVSLLAIEQQQEKDYLSMRGGRRRKSGPPAVPTSNARNVHLSNGFEAFARGFHPPPPPTYSFFAGSPFMGNGLEFRRTNGISEGRGVNRTKARRSNEHSSRSSLRTDSNSSASCVDENKNEERARTGVNTPPPAPYSPHFKILHNTGAREFHNVARYATNYKPPPYHHHNNNNNDEKIKPTDPPSTKNSSSGGAPVSRPVSPQSALSQVHVTTTSQSFAPQARRSRRSIRRNGQAGVSEIGAGDAPLPNDDVCKKFDTLKL